MIFEETRLQGAYVVDLKRIEDNRGFFARGFCVQEFQQQDLIGEMVQLNIAFSHTKGTVRGMHFQESPHAEAKLVRCTRGAIFDVIVDLPALQVVMPEIDNGALEWPHRPWGCVHWKNVAWQREE